MATTKAERMAAADKRRRASETRKRWMDGVLRKERARVADWIEWYWYNRTYAFTADHSMPTKDWEAADVEKMMKDLVRAVRSGEALSACEPVDGWASRGQRFVIAFDPARGQGYRVKKKDEEPP